MFESLVIMVREGVEAALVIGILLVTLRRTGRPGLERYVYGGLVAAVVASLAAAVVLTRMPVNEETYEGVLYLTSALFVLSMMWWVHRRASRLGAQVADHARRAARGGGWSREALAMGAFAFLMVFREGAEAVLLLAAVQLNTDALLSFAGSILGLTAAVAFGVLFVRGTVPVDLGRFFRVTEWILALFVVQLVVNGYHEFAEVGLLPASERSMALVGPMVRHNTLFLLAMLALPLFLWVTASSGLQGDGGEADAAQRRLARARARRQGFYRRAAVAATLGLMAAVGVVHALAKPPTLSPLEPVAVHGGRLAFGRARLADDHLHVLGVPVAGRQVRLLALRDDAGAVHVVLDACEICGASGYTEEDGRLLCRNCSAPIEVATVGRSGGCNPIPVVFRTTADSVTVSLKALQESASLFPPTGSGAGM